MITWRKTWQPTPGFLPGELHGQRDLVGYSPQGREESDTTEWLTLSLSPACSPSQYWRRRQIYFSLRSRWKYQEGNEEVPTFKSFLPNKCDLGFQTRKWTCFPGDHASSGHQGPPGSLGGGLNQDVKGRTSTEVHRDSVKPPCISQPPASFWDHSPPHPHLTPWRDYWAVFSCAWSTLRSLHGAQQKYAGMLLTEAKWNVILADPRPHGRAGVGLVVPSETDS